MAVSRTVIAAYKSTYTLVELRVMLRTALEERASGVALTQVNFQEGGGSGQVLSADPNEMIEILQTAIFEMENPDESGPKPLSSAVTFNRRRSET